MNDANGRFYLDGNALKVKNGAALDFESPDALMVTIKATDGVGRTTTRNLKMNMQRDTTQRDLAVACRPRTAPHR